MINRKSKPPFLWVIDLDHLAYLVTIIYVREYLKADKTQFYTCKSNYGYSILERSSVTTTIRSDIDYIQKLIKNKPNPKKTYILMEGLGDNRFSF